MDTYKATMFPLYLSAVILLWIGITDFIHTSYIAKDSEKFIKKSGQKFPRITFSCICWLPHCAFSYFMTVFNIISSIHCTLPAHSYTSAFYLPVI